MPRTPTGLCSVSKVLFKCQEVMQTHSSKGRSSEQGHTTEAVGPRPGGGVGGELSLRTVEATCPDGAQGLGRPCPAPRPWPRALTFAWPCSSPHPLSQGLPSPPPAQGVVQVACLCLLSPESWFLGCFPVDSHPGRGACLSPCKGPGTTDPQQIFAG